MSALQTPIDECPRLGSGHMTAGESAEDVAKRAAAAADRLEKSAERARRRAEAFAAGAEGERILAASLAGLSVNGWFMLPDRRTSSGGNIDMVLVGPPGVFILDAKHWSGVVSSSGLAIGRFDRTASVKALGGIAADVRAQLARDDAQVRGVLVLTHEANQGHQVRVHDGVVVTGVDQLTDYLGGLTPTLTGADVEAVTGRLMSLVPPAGAAPGPEPSPETDSGSSPQALKGLYDRFNLYYYVQPWSKAGRRRLYLNDETGATVAYKDLVSGVVAVTDEEAGDHARLLLQNASAGSLGLTKATVPRVPASMRGGKLVSSMTRLWTSFHIGFRWRKGALDRLCCVRANPQDGVDEVGYIDLTTGEIYPVHEGPLGKDLRSPRRYLELHVERYRPRT